MSSLGEYVCRKTITVELGSRALTYYRDMLCLVELLLFKEERGVARDVMGTQAGCLHKRTVIPQIWDLHPAPALRWSLKLSSTPVQKLLVHGNVRCCRYHIEFCTRFMSRIYEKIMRNRAEDNLQSTRRIVHLVILLYCTSIRMQFSLCSRSRITSNATTVSLDLEYMPNHVDAQTT
jgi:hypothetical protein